MNRSLFEKYGGFASFHKISAAFYRQVLDSPNLCPYFDNVDIDALVMHQAELLSSSLGADRDYDRPDIRSRHSHLGVKNEDFDEIIEILEETLLSFEMESEDVTVVLDVMEAYREDIVLQI